MLDARAGSSPLARGTFRRNQDDTVACRLIPARAGNITVLVCCPRPCAAHPRSRGEHRKLKPHGTYAAGSSPLARGTYTRHSLVVLVPRLIPARAGNMRRREAFGPCGAAHPRSRGEHVPNIDVFTAARGSSPLARGTSDDAREAVGNPRLIPARAGNIRQAITFPVRR